MFDFFRILILFDLDWPREWHFMKALFESINFCHNLTTQDDDLSLTSIDQNVTSLISGYDAPNVISDICYSVGE